MFVVELNFLLAQFSLVKTGERANTQLVVCLVFCGTECLTKVLRVEGLVRVLFTPQFSGC